MQVFKLFVMHHPQSYPPTLLTTGSVFINVKKQGEISVLLLDH